MAEFTLGDQARSWLRSWNLSADQVVALQNAIRLDLAIEASRRAAARPVRVPSAAAALRHQARKLEQAARVAERAGRRTEAVCR